MKFHACFEKQFNLIIGFLVVLGVLWSLVFIQFTVDDSYITFRYAKNLIDYGVWNWEVNSPFVEAYTNFFFAILAVIPEFLGLSAPLFFKFFGAVLIVYISLRLKSLMNSRATYAMALTAFLTAPYLFVHAFSGLETLFFITLIFDLVVLVTSNSISVNRERFLFAILLLLPLTRPEGALFSLVGFSLYFYKNKGIKEKAFLIFLVMAGAGYFLWRYSYFGYFLPNTFYIKSTNPIDYKDVIHYMISHYHYFVASLIAFILVRDKNFRILITMVVILNIFLYGASDLQMNYGERFPFQTFTPVLLAAFFLLNQRSAFLLLIPLIFITGQQVTDIKTLSALATYYPRAIESHAKLGLALSAYKNERLTLMVGDAGMIPYYSEWESYDSIGLANVYLGHNDMTMKYMESVSPDLIIMYGSSPSEADVKAGKYNQDEIYKYINETQKYSFEGAIKANDNYFILAYLRKDIAEYERISKEIKALEYETSVYEISWSKLMTLGYLRPLN